MATVLFERKGNIGILTFDRPKALNALSTEVIREAHAVMDMVEKEEDIRCLVVTGGGEKAFIAGADIAEMMDQTRQAAKEFAHYGNQFMHRLEEFHAPVIAAIGGFALGGGLELALACDIRLCSENALFGFPEVGLGIAPGFGGMQRFVRAVGVARAKELIYTTRRFGPEEASAYGLVNAVYPREELMDKAMEMATTIAQQAPLSVACAKKAMNAGCGQSQRQAVETEENLYYVTFETEDQKNAMHAFVEKRKPDPFVGR